MLLPPPPATNTGYTACINSKVARGPTSKTRS